MVVQEDYSKVEKNPYYLVFHLFDYLLLQLYFGALDSCALSLWDY